MNVYSYIPVSKLLKLIGDESRQNILCALNEKESCVSELIISTGLPQSLLSHHLKDLKDGNLVESTKKGRWVFYCLSKKGQEIMLLLKGLSEK